MRSFTDYRKTPLTLKRHTVRPGCHGHKATWESEELNQRTNKDGENLRNAQRKDDRRTPKDWKKRKAADKRKHQASRQSTKRAGQWVIIKQSSFWNVFWWVVWFIIIIMSSIQELYLFYVEHGYYIIVTYLPTYLPYVYSPYLMTSYLSYVDRSGDAFLCPDFSYSFSGIYSPQR